MRTALAAVSTAVLLLMPSAAQAATWTHDDRSGDVYRWGRGPVSAAPGQQTADVTRIQVRHTKQRVALTVTMRALPSDGYGVSWFLRTSERPQRYVVQLKRWSADDRSLRLVYGWTERGEYEDVPCPGLGWSRSTASSTITLTVPRTCLERPDWVRSGVETAVADPDPERALYDDALVDGRADYIDPEISGARVAAG